jgi:parallel beta-helix repeat protein
VDDHSSPAITSNTISDNQSVGTGGGVYVGGHSSPTIEDNTITGNTAADDWGGGIGVIDSSSVTIARNTISDNGACDGGGVSFYNGCSGMVSGNTITRNVTGGVTVDHSSELTVSGNTISENSGSGIYIAYSAPTVLGNMIRENTTSGVGGGILVEESSSAKIIGNEIVNNASTEDWGGGIGVIASSSVQIERNLIAGNQANYGGGISFYGSSSGAIVHSTIVSNSAQGSGGGILCYASTLTIRNTIMGGNTATDEGPEVSLGDTSTVTITYSNVAGGEEAIVKESESDILLYDNNMDQNPLFVDPAGGDYHLQAGSPCMDAGDPESEQDPDGTVADMGAFAFDQRQQDIVPPSVPTGLSTAPRDGELILTWSPNTEPDLSHYIIYQSQTQGFSPMLADSVGSVDKPDTAFTDTGLTNGITYYYRISAVDSSGNESSYSEEASATPLAPGPDKTAPEAPTDLTANGSNPSPWQNTSSFVLTWTNPLDESGIAKVYYKLDSKPTSKEDTTGTASGTPPFTLEVSQEGEIPLYLWLEDGVGNVDYAETAYVTLRYDATSPLIVWTPVTTQAEGRDLTVSASVTDAGGVQSVILHYRTGGMPLFNTSALSKAGGDPYEATIPGSAVTSRGLEYYVSATDHTGNSATVPKEGADKPYCVQVTFQDYIAEAAYPVGIWKMVGVPVMPDNGSPFEILTALGTYDISKWRLFRFYWGAYHEFTHEDIGNFEPGRAFWLHTKIPDFKFRTGGGGTTPTDAPFDIRLEPGWSDISCPFAFPVRWDEVMAQSGDPAGVSGPYTYDSAAWSFPNPTDRLEPWEGYAVKNANTAAVTLQIPPLSAEGSAKPLAKPLSDGEWILRVKVEAADCGMGNPKSVDVNNFLGFRSNAQMEWDRLDLPEPPPAPGEHLSLYFPHEEWVVYPDEYTSDFRPESDGTIWTFVVESNLEGKKAALSFDGIADLPAGLKAFLLDMDGRISVNLRAGMTVPVTVGRNRRTFRIVVGSAGYVEKAAADFRGVPEGIALSPNRPNPFNAKTVIAYQLSEPGNVRLGVYDLLGREVVVLVDAVSDPGYFSTVWHGKDENGKEAASGVYFCILATQRERSVSKMVMVR